MREVINLETGSVYEFTYCNHEQKVEKRLVQCKGIAYGTFPFHKYECWVMYGFCLDRRAHRTFELGRMGADIVKVA